MCLLRLFSLCACLILSIVILICSCSLIISGDGIIRLREYLYSSRGQIPDLPMINKWLTKKSRPFNPAKDKVEECAICMMEFNKEDKSLIAELNCHEKHVFHLTCIKMWVQNNDICPMCRTPILSNQQK